MPRSRSDPRGGELQVAGDFNVKTVRYGGRLEGVGNRGGAKYRRIEGYVGLLPPALAPMVPEREDVEHGMGREQGKVPDGLHPGYKFPSILEFFRPGPQA